MLPIMKARSELLIAVLTACTLLAGSALSTGQDAGHTQIRVLDHSAVFFHPSSDPYARDNYRGFNHAPSVVLLPDGRLLTAWFSGPFEASVDQAILGSYSTDGGKSWERPVVLQDFLHLSDFDPAFIADGNKTLLFFSAGRENRYPPVHEEEHSIPVRTDEQILFPVSIPIDNTRC